MSKFLNKEFFSSKSDEWSTPLDLFNILNAEFSFNLDPCSSDLNFLCENHFTKIDNGLVQNWSGYNVFCNPPYSDIKNWVKKCYDEFLKNNTLIVLLIPARTDTKYFHEYILPYAEIRFIKGRLRFGGSSQNAPFPSIICVFRGKI